MTGTLDRYAQLITWMSGLSLALNKWTSFAVRNWYTLLVEVNQAILAWSFRQKVISKHMIWSVSTRQQFFKAWPCCQNEIMKLDHSLSHILTHLYVLSLLRHMSNWPINGKAIQNQNLHVTNSANQRCSWQYIRSRQNWQDSLGNMQT